MSPRPIKNRVVELLHCRPDELLDHPLQHREHGTTQRKILQSLVQEVGIASAVIAYRSPAQGGRLVKIDGHLRTSEIDTAWPTLVLDVTDEEATMLLSAMDPLAALATFDDEGRQAAIAAFQTQDALLQQFFAGAFNEPEEPAADEDEKPEDQQRITDPTLEQAIKDFGIRLGQTWRISSTTQPGRFHYLHHGDCTDGRNWVTLMTVDGRQQQADLVFTDPPYGVSYQQDAIQNDQLTGQALEQFLADVFRLTRTYTAEHTPWYIWHPSANRREFMWAMDAAGLVERQYLIWAKPSLVLGHADYQHQVEPCFYAHVEGESPPFFGDRSQTTFWQIGATGYDAAGGMLHVTAIGPHGLVVSSETGHDLFLSTKQPKGRKLRRIRLKREQITLLKPEAQTSDLWVVSRDPKVEHPTQKPLALARRALLNSSRRGSTVLDPFMGSGTTLLAAEQTGRLGCGFELEPKWIAYLLLRATGLGLAVAAINPGDPR